MGDTLEFFEHSHFKFEDLFFTVHTFDFNSDRIAGDNVAARENFTYEVGLEKKIKNLTAFIG